LSGPPRRARDIGLVDAIDALAPRPLSAEVFRVAKAGRDPTEPARSKGRWSDGSFDALYTSLERDGARAEIFALLSMQPIIPTRDAWHVHRLKISASRALDLANFETLKMLGVDVERYESRNYSRTQVIGEAAFFLGADGVIVPRARSKGLNFVAFADRLSPANIEIIESFVEPIDWSKWRGSRRP
jgi:RES domain-containing protein